MKYTVNSCQLHWTVYWSVLEDIAAVMVSDVTVSPAGFLLQQQTIRSLAIQTYNSSEVTLRQYIKTDKVHRRQNRQLVS